MPVINANFQDVQAFGQSQPVPAGLYQTKIDKFDLDKSSTGKPMFKVDHEVVGSDQDDPKLIGRHLFDNIVMHKNDGSDNPVAFSQLKAYAIACLGEEAANGSSVDTDSFVGQTVLLEVKQRTYKDSSGNEKVGNEIARVLPVS